MKKFIKKYCYTTMPIIFLMIFMPILYGFKLNTIIDNMSSDAVGTIIGMAGTLIGFLFTAVNIFLSLPKDNDIMKRVIRSKHPQIFGTCALCGVTFLSICIVLWLFEVYNIIIVTLFLEGLVETLICVYYTYKLCLYNFQ